MKLHIPGKGLGIILIACVCVVCAFVISLTHNLTSRNQETPKIEPEVSTHTSQTPAKIIQTTKKAPDKESKYAEELRKTLMEILQPEAEKYAEEQNKKETEQNTLVSSIIHRASKGNTYEEKIDILKSYLNHPELTEQDLYQINRKLASWLFHSNDYESVSKIYDEMEALCKDDPDKLLDLEIRRALLDYYKGDSETAIGNLSEIASLPVPENFNESIQSKNVLLHILFASPRALSNIYNKEGNSDKAILLLDDSINRAFKFYEEYPESKISFDIIGLLGNKIMLELEERCISVEEAHTYFDDMVEKLKDKSLPTEDVNSLSYMRQVYIYRKQFDNLKKRGRGSNDR